MNTEVSKIIKELKAGQFGNIYAFDGEEGFYNSLLEKAFEDYVLKAEEKDFNLSILYGKDVDWKQVMNVSLRPPMFGNYHLVIVKDAASVKGLASLAKVLEKIPKTTVLVISHKYKKIDGRTALLKSIKKHGVHLSFKKLYDNQVPSWVLKYVKSLGLSMSDANASLLAANLGTDLQKIANELDKVSINLEKGQEVNSDIIEQYIGISKDYNIWEFLRALLNRNSTKVYGILNYMVSNPKAIYLIPVLAGLNKNLQAIYLLQQNSNFSDQTFLNKNGFNSYLLRDCKNVMHLYNEESVRKGFKLLYEYNLKIIGVGTEAKESSLFKEFTAKYLSI